MDHTTILLVTLLPTLVIITAVSIVVCCLKCIKRTNLHKQAIQHTQITPASSQEIHPSSNNQAKQTTQPTQPTSSQEIHPSSNNQTLPRQTRSFEQAVAISRAIPIQIKVTILDDELSELLKRQDILLQAFNTTPVTRVTTNSLIKNSTKHDILMQKLRRTLDELNLQPSHIREELLLTSTTTDTQCKYCCYKKMVSLTQMLLVKLPLQRLQTLRHRLITIDLTTSIPSSTDIPSEILSACTEHYNKRKLELLEQHLAPVYGVINELCTYYRNIADLDQCNMRTLINNIQEIAGQCEHDYAQCKKIIDKYHTDGAQQSGNTNNQEDFSTLQTFLTNIYLLEEKWLKLEKYKPILIDSSLMQLKNLNSCHESAHIRYIHDKVRSILSMQQNFATNWPNAQNVINTLCYNQNLQKDIYTIMMKISSPCTHVTSSSEEVSTVYKFRT